MTTPRPRIPVRAALLPISTDHSTPPLRRTRVWLRGTLAAWCLSRHEPDLSLIATELVTNALTHASGPVTVSLRCDRTRLRLAVTDTGDGQPRLLDGDEESTCGRGMLIVNALCDQWGSTRHGTTKTVWRVRRQLPAAPAPRSQDPVASAMG
ncbi:ATP-binding protein [Streptomyces werraensis]|uniref:ATP-binding protein n=1 Tax=Streptomyces werraensis TaxID=68284 RepID=UPI0037F24013